MAEHSHLLVADLCAAIIETMRPSSGAFDDDVALVVARTRGSTPDRFIDLIHATPAALSQVRRHLRSWLAASPLSPKQRHEVLLVAGEAVANAVEHGCQLDQTGVVAIEAVLRQASLDLSVTDTGVWADNPVAEAADGRGRGFAIMRALSGRVDVDRSNLGTTVKLQVPISA